MNIQKLITLYCLLIVGINLCAQNLIWKDSIEFHDAGIHKPLLEIDEEHNALYVAAHQYETQWNIILIKYDLSGNKEWERIIDFGWLDLLENLKIDNQGNIIIQKNGWSLYKYNPDGDLIWDYHYFLDDYIMEANDFVLNDENEIYFAGRRFDPNDTASNKNNAHFSKIDENGYLVWSMDYEFEKGFRMSLNEDTLNVFGVTLDSSYCMLKLSIAGDSLDYNEFQLSDPYFPTFISSDQEGNYYSGAWFEAYGTEKINNEGTIEWSYEFIPQIGESPLRSHFNKVDELSNVYIGGEIYGDTADIDVLITKLSENGNMLWESKYGNLGDSLVESVRDLSVTAENLLVTGSIVHPDNKKESYFMSIDNLTGEILYDEVLNSNQGFTTTGYSIKGDSNGNIYIVGSGLRNDSLGLELLDIYKYMPIMTSSNHSSKVDVQKLFPNPANTQITITGVDKDIFIYNLNGQLMKQIKYNGESSININIEPLPKGMYVVTSTMEGKRMTWKFIKS